MSDDIDTLREFINFAHRDRNSPELLEQSLTAYDALKRVSAERDSLRAKFEKAKVALSLAESVYRKNCVAEGEPSSVLDAMQAVLSELSADEPVQQQISDDGYEFEVIQDRHVVAVACAANRDDALREAMNYAAVYGQDGPCQLREVKKTRRANDHRL